MCYYCHVAMYLLYSETKKSSVFFFSLFVEAHTRITLKERKKKIRKRKSRNIIKKVFQFKDLLPFSLYILLVFSFHSYFVSLLLFFSFRSYVFWFHLVMFYSFIHSVATVLHVSWAFSKSFYVQQYMKKKKRFFFIYFGHIVYNLTSPNKFCYAYHCLFLFLLVGWLVRIDFISLSFFLSFIHTNGWISWVAYFLFFMLPSDLLVLCVCTHSQWWCV